MDILSGKIIPEYFWNSSASLGVILVSCFFSMNVNAQSESKNNYRYENYFDLAVSGSDGNFVSALSWSHWHEIGKKQKLKIGYGARFSSFVGANKYYTTAPSKYTSPVQSLGTIFSETILQNIYTITTTTAFVNSLNAALYMQYSISPKFEVGFNIDAIGFSFGAENKFNIISSSFDPNQAPVQLGSPTKFNLLLTSDNDIGSLNSELYFRYWINSKIGIRAGATFFFSEYRTNKNLSFDNGRIVNDRYRYKSLMGLLAVTFRPFNKN